MEKKMTMELRKKYMLVDVLVLASLLRYGNEHLPTGGFLRAVLENDLRTAVARADDYNMATLRDIVTFIYSELPRNCWGSPERVSTWLGETTQKETP
jgi:hypothetical protein